MMHNRHADDSAKQRFIAHTTNMQLSHSIYQVSDGLRAIAADYRYDQIYSKHINQ